MTLNEYQQQAMTTCLPTSNNFAYMLYNFLGEVGEMLDKIEQKYPCGHLRITANVLERYSRMAKVIRKQPDSPEAIKASAINDAVSLIKDDLDIQKEHGDILWQHNGICSVLGWTEEDIAQQNLDKLASRQQRNQIDGNGDNR